MGGSGIIPGEEKQQGRLQFVEEMSRMRRQMTAIETIREFCRVWFEERTGKRRWNI